MNLLKALVSISGMTLLSRILGFARDTLQARLFGASLASDAFVVAFRLPNLLRRLFAEGAFSQAFVPILAEYKARRGHEATHELVDHVATLLGLALAVITLIGVLAAPVLVYISAPGFHADPAKFDLTVQLLRLTFPYILFISLVALAGGILNTHSKFSVTAFTPVLLNVAFIICALWLAPHLKQPIMALAIAVPLGGILQLGFQVPFLLKLNMLPRPRFNLLSDEGVWRILKQMGPAVLGVSVSQISLLINTVFISYLPSGSMSWLYYADRLMEFPSGMLGVALGTILLPSLSKHYADKSHEEYSTLLDWGLRLTLLLALPSAVALAILAQPLIAALFYHGHFSALDVEMSRQALVAYSVGLLGLILVKVLAPGFYASQNIKTPVKIAIFTLTLTQIMNIVFIFVIKLNHAGLALATGLGACANSALLYYKLRKHGIYRPQPGWGIFALKVGAAISAMSAALWLTMGSDEHWLHISLIARWPRLAGLVVLGAAVYLGTLYLLGLRLHHFIRRAAE